VGRAAGSDGYVTLAVLLVVGLLAAIAASLLAVSRPALGLARIGGDEAVAEGLVQGGLTTAAYLLFAANVDSSKVDQVVLRQHTGEIRLSVADEGALVDLNSAEPDMLAGLFAAVGAKSLSGQAFSSRVLDWRDEDSDVNEDGGEASEYADAGLDYGPSNLPFHSVEEARFILGLSPPDFDRLKPFLTVYSGTSQVDPLSAPETVLRAIPGANRRDVQQLMRARVKDLDRSRLTELVPTISERLLTQASGVYRVRVDVALPDGYTDAVEAVIVGSQGGGSADYRTVAWSRLASAPRTQ
jgi:general secretion pathway protein K